MKALLISLAALQLAASVHGQGTVNFVNKITGLVDARVFYGFAPTPAVGGGTTPETQFVAQLYAAVPGGTLAAVGAPIPFRNPSDPAGLAGTGYWPGETRTIPGVTEGGMADVKVVAWSTAVGSTYEAALAKGMGYLGESARLSVLTGGGLNPPTALVGLASFNISPIVPEPSPLVLGLLGTVILLAGRREPRACGA